MVGFDRARESSPGRRSRPSPASAAGAGWPRAPTWSKPRAHLGPEAGQPVPGGHV